MNQCILLKKKNFDKNETESKMEHLTHSFRERSLVLQHIEESQIKSKTVISWNSREERGHFLYIFFYPKESFLIFVF